MKHVIPAALALGLFATGAAFAQSAPAKSDSTAPAAVATSENPRTAAAPVAGANSYTENQARARLEEKGFGNVNDLKKDDKGIWRATAMKDGKSTPVSLDYQGNVVSN
jgi:hypothetical protein